MSFVSSKMLRSHFLHFFQQLGHTVVRSSPLVPSDPSLLFTNAGMVQFKDAFTGKQTLDFKRAASVQKCVRAGGKHNDLDNVGRTARHHTFFEMLGNFSFGDYSKEDAITYAWQFLHRELQLPKDRLWFTVFRGEEGIPADDEARALWKRVADVSDDRVLGLGKKDNFWMMGDTGPQGPCSEIHFFQGDDIPCAEVAAGRSCQGPACDCDRFLEIWNLVFMQFERKEKDGALLPLPAPSIDTGAGLERLLAVLQGKRSNYDTDLFQPLVEVVESNCKKEYMHTDGEDDISMRVLSDHSRAASFLIADGVLPSNLGRGYVLRSILRRAIRHAVRLDLPAGFFALLCEHVTAPAYLGETYPELVAARALIRKAVDAEDEGFRQTIHRGLKLISDTKGWQETNGRKVLPGSVAFQLHDTYGFPLDLTQVIGREQGFVVDEAGFAEAMEQQRNRSKFVGSGDTESAAVYHQLREQHGSTSFVGYDKERGNETTDVVLALLVQGKQVGSIAAGQEAEIITSQTPFYGRAGGQVGDTGKIENHASQNMMQGQFLVEDTWKPIADFIVHKGKMESGTLQVGDSVHLRVDTKRRDLIRKNHSATHLLHHALRKVLGDHVTQKGSYVGADKLTFDYSHFVSLTTAQKQQIEQMVNEAIWQNADQQVTETDFDQARILGALALFGEKYGASVRVMKLGDSVELCGGTHVWRTGDIGLFKIVNEAGIAKGVRRLEAVTGPAALAWVQNIESHLVTAAALLKTEPGELENRVVRLLEDHKTKEKELLGLKQKLLQQDGDGFHEEKKVQGMLVIIRQVDEADSKALREAAETLRDQKHADVVVLGGTAGDKVALAVAATKTAIEAHKMHAGTLASQLGTAVGGKGGGRADVAQAGGNQPSRLKFALQQVFAWVEQNTDV